MERSGNQVVIYPSKAKLWGIVVVSAAAIAMAVHILVREHNPVSGYSYPFWGLLPEYLGIPFFAVVLGYAINRLVKWYPTIAIDDDGLTVYNPWRRSVHIEWREIAEAYTFDMVGFHYLAIIPIDPGEIRSRFGPTAGVSFAINKATTGAGVQIAQLFLDFRVTDIIRTMAQYGVKVRHK